MEEGLLDGAARGGRRSGGSRPPARLREVSRGVRRLRRRVWEAFGSDRYSRCARFDMDRKLEAYLPERGFFVEAGAADGVRESNTYFLERIRGWEGVLVEPIPSLSRRCAKERPRSRVFQCALVSEAHEGSTVEMFDGHLMSLVRGSLGDPAEEARRLEAAAHWHGANGRVLEVPARTLSSILDEVGVERIDFFSLDVEGYELEVLRGLDLRRHRPAFILVESLDAESGRAVDRHLRAAGYAAADRLSPRDRLYRAL